MKNLSRLLLAFLAPLGAGCGMTVYRPPEAERELKFPDDLEVHGLAFFEGRLYATTGQGILEFDQGRLSGLCRWDTRWPIVRSQGPWVNRMDGSLRFKESGAKFLLKLDHDGWSSWPMPEPRGDFIPIRFYSNEDFTAHSDTGGFWLSSSLETWRWDPEHRSWPEERLPSAPGGVVTVAPLEGGLLAILWKGSSVGRLVDASQGKPFESDEVYVREEGKDWRLLRNEGEPIATKDLVASLGAAYFFNWNKGEVIEATSRGLRRLHGPGVCEALAVTGEGDLLASFLDRGIYRYTVPDGPWTAIFPSPYPQKERKHHAYLAEDRGTVAMAVTDFYHPRPPTPERRTTFWMSRNGRLEELRWVP